MKQLMSRAGMFALVAVVGIVIAGCGGSSDSSDSSGSESASAGEIPEGPITIGAPLALTGDISFVDSGMKQGIDLAVSEINSKGGVDGHEIEVVTADTKSDPATIGTAAQEVIDQGIDFMIPTFDYDFGGPAARLAMGQDIVSVSGAGDPRYGLEGIGDLMFNVYPGSPTEGAVGAEFAYNDQGWKNVYVLTDQTFNHAKTVCSAFKERFTELGGTISGDATFKGTDRSIATQVTDLRNAAGETDAIMMCTVGDGGVSALRQIRGGGIDSPVILDNAYDGTYWFKAAPSDGDIYVISVGAVTPGVTDSELQAKILKDAEAQSGEPVTFGVGTFAGYSSVQAIADAVEATGTIDSDAIRDELETFKNKDLAIGPVTWTEECHVPLGEAMQILKVDPAKSSQEYVTTIKPTEVPDSPC